MSALPRKRPNSASCRNDARGQERSKNYDVIAASAYCALRFVLPKLISGLRKPIAIQATISFNMNLPE
jgi:hypothetical protein